MSYELEIIDLNAVIEVTQPSNVVLEFIESPGNILEITEISDTETVVLTKIPVIEVLEIADRGLPGDSAYEIALLNGFIGTEVEWLNSLHGSPGSDSTDGNFSESFVITSALEQNFTLSYTPSINSLRGFLNGLREKNNAFGLSGNTVSFSLLDLAAGDELTFDYRFEI